MNTKINNNLNITEGSFGYPSLQYSSPSVVSEKDEYKMNITKNPKDVKVGNIIKTWLGRLIVSEIKVIQMKNGKNKYNINGTVIGIKGRDDEYYGVTMYETSKVTIYEGGK